MKISAEDRTILRRLAAEQAQIAALPIHNEKKALWARLNQLQSVRSMVWITEVPWHEMNVDDELTLQCQDPRAREIEQGFRRLLYQWRHLPADMIVDDFYECPLVIHSTGMGLQEDVDIVRTDAENPIVSRHFHPQIVEPEDIEKIRMPQVTYDAEATERNFQQLWDLFGDILPVRKVGKRFIWTAPWDELVRWWGIQPAMMDLVLRPEMVHAAMQRLMDAYLSELDQWQALNLLACNNTNVRIGSGGYGYTNELPGQPFDPEQVQPHNMWGSSTAQIFSAVSPEMHWEFAVRHELRWLERWQLTYYGCCEPLDQKMEVVRRIPNLRKISMSPWIKVERAAQTVGADYVFSRKPNPAIFALDTWQPQEARRQIQEVLDHTQGCHVEFIMKDISTVRYDPQRLWKWERLIMQMVS